jgi:hypothetical protein
MSSTRVTLALALAASRGTFGACPFSGRTAGKGVECPGKAGPNGRRLQQNIGQITTAWLAGNPIPGGPIPGVYEEGTVYPYDVMPCATAPVLTTSSFSESEYDRISSIVVAEMNRRAHVS